MAAMRAVCGSSSTVAGHLAGGTHHAFRGVQQLNSTQLNLLIKKNILHLAMLLSNWRKGLEQPSKLATKSRVTIASLDVHVIPYRSIIVDKGLRY